MHSSSFPLEPSAAIVFDASVAINLNATGCASDIITALPNAFSVTENALAELERGGRNGHCDAEKLQALIDRGIVRLVGLGEAGSRIYELLIEGSALRTLDDGEAATIACASEIHGLAIIDERKARKLCAEMFPNLALACTVELLTHEAVAAAIGRQGQIDAVLAALHGARMRVPPSQIGKVVSLIGKERATSCTSLPRAVRALG